METRSRRQRLGLELCRLRDQAGLSGRELAQRTGVISQSKVSRIESGGTVPSLPEVMAWADAVGASNEVRERLVGLTEAAFTEVHTWRKTLQERDHLQSEIQEREERARLIRTFHPSVVPGLLQTADYARRVFTLFQLPYAEETVASAVAGRLHRQQALYEEDRKFDFLVTEAALRWRSGSPTSLIAQLHRIASVSTLDNVSVGIIPSDSQAEVLIPHGFVIYDGHSDQDAFVSVETIHANLIINDSDEIALYETRWSLLGKMAIFDGAAQQFLLDLITAIQSAMG